MAHRTPQLWENEGFRGLALTVLALGLLVWLFDFSTRSAVMMGLIVGASGLHDLLDERYGLPAGSNGMFYGGSMVAVGVGGVALGETWFVAFAAVGAWFVLDGAATMQAGVGTDHHEYAADLDDASNSEAMLRMQVLGSVHEELRENGEPRTPAEVADALGLAEGQAASALDYLETRGQVERVDGRYRAEKPRWGKLQPVASFVRWLPRRLGRPFRLLLG